MGIIVQKYGGTSVGDVERIKNVADKVIKTFDQGNDVVVVLSAMSGVTNDLLRLANEASDNPDKRELDVLLSTGEQTTIALLAMILKSRNYKAVSLVGSQADIRTNNISGNARIMSIGSGSINQLLKDRNIVIVAGFQGYDVAGNITTLGRGGSDTSAVAIAAAIKADMCEIYTDVDGIYTTDPRICTKARKLEKISYDEMLEMSSLGAKVLQIRSVSFAKKYNVPIHVRSSFNEEKGTMVVSEDKGMESILVSGVALDRDQARVTIKKVPDIPGISARIFTPLAEGDVSVDMIIQNTRSDSRTDISFTVTKNDYKKALEISNRVADEIGASGVICADQIAKISVIGVGMKNHSGVAASMFQALADENINIRLIATSEIRISCMIEEKYAELAVRVLHDTFNLDKNEAIQS
ncbi:MAG: aspartate kinase [Desulfobacterales bacterium]|nr:aspartate kinase [Desulfobacterales bacterium]MCP4163055.1 aspartate kinase [Deltaproteobacteria bacterium]